ncbi:cbb3-type cytochrome oxidase assembly protein CcoS [Mangrovibacterium sp.]|uniref:cbb3-type cytochrome oxidase assembly protein CcoS n=1 Tax=Mangrovibacterium sp. TaxID=1961364 RepID=UPI003562DDC5
MSVLFILVIIGIIVASLFLIAFIWAVRSGQYDDTYTPSIRILFDDHISSSTEDEPQDELNSKPKST